MWILTSKHQAINLLLLLACLVLSSCSTVTKVDNSLTGYDAKASDCKVQIFHNTKVNQAHSSLSKIETHIQKNFFFGGKVNLDDEAFDELRAKTCELGGDGIIIDDFIETSVSEMTHIHVWATVIKFIEKTDQSIDQQ